MSTFHNHYNQHSQHPRPWLYPQTVLGIADCNWNWLWGPSWNLRAWCTGCPWQVGWTYSRSNDSSALKSRNFNRLFGIAFGSVFWCTVPGIETIWWQHDKMTMTKWQYMLCYKWQNDKCQWRYTNKKTMPNLLSLSKGTSYLIKNWKPSLTNSSAGN